MQAFVKTARLEKRLSYGELAERLQKRLRIDIDVQVLTNRINQGTYSHVFALELLAVMGYESLPIPKLTRAMREKPARKDAVD